MQLLCPFSSSSLLLQLSSWPLLWPLLLVRPLPLAWFCLPCSRQVLMLLGVFAMSDSMLGVFPWHTLTSPVLPSRVLRPSPTPSRSMSPDQTGQTSKHHKLQTNPMPRIRGLHRAVSTNERSIAGSWVLNTAAQPSKQPSTTHTHTRTNRATHTHNRTERLFSSELHRHHPHQHQTSLHPEHKCESPLSKGRPRAPLPTLCSPRTLVVASDATSSAACETS